MLFPRLMTRVTVLAAIVCVASAGYAQKSKTLESGLTSVKLSSTFTSALTALHVTPGTVAPTHIYNGIATFPITGGAIDLDTALGNVIHSGGLTLTAGNTSVKLQSFIIDTTGASPVLTGLVVVNEKLVGRLPLFNVIPPANVSLPLKLQGGFVLQLSGVKLTLTSTAATALNQVFSVSAFAGGLNIGNANVFSFVNWHD